LPGKVASIIDDWQRWHIKLTHIIMISLLSGSLSGCFTEASDP